ncbi:hypothetical protein [Curtobacterium sp. VKM Ac-1376]|uniref:hypothetical protein n=1 Tax=Curtobacterium sp. VKM Ac-1376 TaxID=123312 RepID=UPI00188B7B1C|nr:hypothetical protein [Curtobacterium sp. VKM Ac-1376]MBF4613768.1 hypothetical protein [Curtobacterium sp. VKM Ac-1376]
MTGVPQEEVTASDFIIVRAALVKRLGGANQALVWARIHFRCNDGGQRHIDENEVAWWPASSAQIGEEVGLSEKQVDRATKDLRDGGFVESVEHRIGGNWDHTKSWRPLVRAGSPDSPNSGNRSPEFGDRKPRNRGQEAPNSGNPSSIKKLQEEVQEGSPSDAAATDQGAFSDDVIYLCDLLAELIRANGNKVGTVGVTWWSAGDRLMRLDGYTREQVEWVMRWSQTDEFWQGNILSMPKLREKFDTLKTRALAERRQRMEQQPRSLTNAEQAALDYQRKYGGNDGSAGSIQTVGAGVSSR